MSKGETVLALREAGLSNKQIAAALDMPVPSVRRLASETAKRPKVSYEDAMAWGSRFEAAARFQEQQPSPIGGTPARGGGSALVAATVQPLPTAQEVASAARFADVMWQLTEPIRSAQRKPTHIVIPDSQCKPGVPLDHLKWAGQYIAERKPDVVVHLGDHWDLPSLSSYESKGSHYFEGKRLKADIGAGNEGLDLLMEGMGSFRPKRMVMLRGNHEDRLTRAINENPTQLAGLVGFEDFNDVAHGWEVIDYLTPVTIDGIAYAHYFYHPNTGRAYSGSVDNMLRSIGHSFTMGHQQGKRMGSRELGNGDTQRGLVVGSFYDHQEDYKGPQGNHHWRGIIACHEVGGGTYDLMEVSIDFLRNRFGGTTQPLAAPAA